ncbi:transglycosylase SLT domain-containing protein [Trinickia dinghuensis]|uniref:Lytic transglycosylase n=1 Tax=Trinickia dinghuensis TaxID=2291023 RepID=A0A3D8K4R4_9BURK|nr:transglycosylase SLT domain-containing protein [Trinickia dinghuensis]RDU99854.1 lytic transglycosylase [Trinickia dinghuensis]
MSRLFCLLLLSLGLAASVNAQESEASRALAGAAAAVGASHSLAAASSSSVQAAALPSVQAILAAAAAPEAAASDPVALAPIPASDPAPGQVHRIRDMLTRRFGLARAKAEQISSAVMASASKYSLPPALVLAIISIESRFQDHARGKHGATGLMQVVPAAHKRLVKNLDLTEPAANIEAGSAILHGYLESARGDVGAALKSYGGSTAYARKVSLRAKDFETVGAASGVDTAAPFTAQ